MADTPPPPAIRVLVVDDHPVNLAMAHTMLAKLGCRVETAPDGPSALEAASRHDFDLVLMDCQMAGMDGFEATRRLRAREASGRRVPIIALTAHDADGFRERCLAAGFDDCLSKPFLLDELAAVLEARVPERPRLPGGLRERAGYDGLDWSRLDAFGSGSPDGGDRLRELVDLFLETGREGLETIRLALREGRRGDAARNLHRLKGACATLGAAALCRRIEALEARLPEGPAGDLGEGYGDLEREFGRIEAALRA